MSQIPSQDVRNFSQAEQEYMNIHPSPYQLKC